MNPFLTQDVLQQSVNVPPAAEEKSVKNNPEKGSFFQPSIAQVVSESQSPDTITSFDSHKNFFNKSFSSDSTDSEEMSDSTLHSPTEDTSFLRIESRSAENANSSEPSLHHAIEQYKEVCSRFNEQKSKIFDELRERRDMELSLEKLITACSTEAFPEFEADFEKEDFNSLANVEIRVIRDFARLHANAEDLSSSNVELRKKYEQEHALFKKVLTEYLVCRKVANLRLEDASDKEIDVLLASLEQKKKNVEKSITRLKFFEQEMEEDQKRNGRLQKLNDWE